jgi:hypothetical protein
MPVTLQVILPALLHTVPSLLNTSWHRGVELLSRTINVLFGKDTVNRLNVVLICRHNACGVDEAFGKKSAERSTNLRHSNDDETGENGLQRLKMLSSTVERKAAVRILNPAS